MNNENIGHDKLHKARKKFQIVGFLQKSRFLSEVFASFIENEIEVRLLAQIFIYKMSSTRSGSRKTKQVRGRGWKI